MSVGPARMDGDRDKLILTAAAGIAFGYVASLALMAMGHGWPVDAQGRPTVEDFVAFWVSGKLALKGGVLAVFDPAALHAAEAKAIGHPFCGALGWSYPPLFLIVAVTLAQLPYAASFFLWVSATCVAHAAVVARIAGTSAAFFVACAAPWVLTAAMTGQNGFLTAALIGGALLALERRPAIAGLLLGLLSFKPQLGILFPLALAAGGYWRAFGWAAVFSLALNLAGGAVFGFASLGAFAHALSLTAQSHLVHNGAGWWFKLQSPFGLVRDMGGSIGLAWTAQIAVLALAVAAVITSWRSDMPLARKAALLAAFVPLATPYVFDYDLPVLAMAVAFAFRDRAFDRSETLLLGVTIPAIFAQLWLPLPTGMLASLAVAAIALRRAYPALSRSRMSPSWVTDATSLPSSE